MTTNRSVTHPDQLERIKRARINLILDEPFFGSLIMSLKMVESFAIPTFATDGRSLLYNPTFCATLKDDEVCGVLIHEVGHCVLLHFARREERDPVKWNIATDHAINLWIDDYVTSAKSMGIRVNYTLPDCGIMKDQKYRGMGAEEIYSLLPQNASRSSLSPGDVMDQPKDGEGAGQDGKNSEQKGGASAIQDATCSTEEEWKIAVKQAAAVAKGQGKLPACAERLAGLISEPKIDWRTELRELLTAVAADDYSWRRPNMRYAQTGFILPSLKSERMGEVVVCIDTSGSIGDTELAAFMSETLGILENCKPSKIYLIQCNSAIGSVDELQVGDSWNVKLTGGGGTSFVPPFEWVEENLQEPPAALIYLTDMMGEFPAHDPGFPVIWCSIVASAKGNAPFGRGIFLDINSK